MLHVPIRSKLLAIALLSCLVPTGACIIRPAADSILSVEPLGVGQRKKYRMGFDGAWWKDVDKRVVVYASGSRYWAHFTYVFFLNEGFPAPIIRTISLVQRLGSDDQFCANFDIELACDPLLLGQDDSTNRKVRRYRGTGHLDCSLWFGKRRFELDDIELVRIGDPSELVRVSGHIVAKFASDSMVRERRLPEDLFNRSRKLSDEEGTTTLPQ